MASDGKTRTEFDENRSPEVNVEKRETGHPSKRVFLVKKEGRLKN